MEEWKDIENYENYEVSNFGKVRNKITNKLIGYYGGEYMVIMIKRKILKIHKLVANAFLEKIEGKEIIDHIDRNKLNNNVNNLRYCNIMENNRNTEKRNNTSSIFKGVSWEHNKYLSYIYLNYKQIRLGRYNTEIEASNARNKYIQDNNLSFF